MKQFLSILAQLLLFLETHHCQTHWLLKRPTQRVVALQWAVQTSMTECRCSELQIAPDSEK